MNNLFPSGRSIIALLSSWRAEPDIASNVVAWRTTPRRPASLVAFPNHLHPALVDSLKGRGIDALYTHQAESWEYLQSGENLIVVTGTASGKTLCYALPVLDRLLRDEDSRALFLFPTKALAQDQVASLKAQFSGLTSEKWSNHATKIPIATYDGDTPSDMRPTIRANARIVVSNPDMLHAGILPHHTLWAEFFRHLQFVVLDEMHAYRGVFGSHVANVLRRLKRIARFYGSAPVFILTSATIANPTELAERLIEERVALIADDGSSKGEKHFLMYNPPVVNHALGIRRSTLLESTRLAQSLLANDIQTIIFTRARRTVELMLKYLSNTPSALERQIRGYRAGYLPNERRDIEHGLRDGAVRAVVATNALELGIDIGGMGAAVLVGYPGTIAATWQQAGRAGRSDEPSLAVLVTSADPLDQFLAHHPNYLFERSPEQALIDPDNLLILLQHLRCAAFELPFHAGESFGRVEGSRVAEFLRVLQVGGILHRSGEKFFWMADQYPADGASLRSASAETVVLEAEGSTVGEVDLASANWMVHPGAIYLHEARCYAVDDLDLLQNIAHLRAVDVDYYTEPRRETTVRLLDRLSEVGVEGGTKSHGEIAVTTQVVGYRKVRWLTHENLGEGIVSLPPTELHTTAYWLALNEVTVETLRSRGLWSNDRNDYGPNWIVQRDRARERDHFQCQNCGTPENGRAHPVHHKIPFRAFTSYEQANSLENLATLCPICHQRAEEAVRLRSGLAGLAYTLGHLAPLFLMCDRTDIGVHSDPRAPLSDGRPAVIIYDQIPAGIGFSQKLFEIHDELVARAHDLVTACECLDGCPSCVGPGGENGFGGKRESLALLKAITLRNGTERIHANPI